jgi:dTDP-4-dehydrorhamnose reductase
MILLLGASGYVGGAFQRELKRRGLAFRALSRADVDYTRPHLVIHAAGFTGKPNVDACEAQRSATLLGNVVLTQTVAQACDSESVPLGFVSSGCIFTGAQVQADDGTWTVREDLTAPDLQALLEARSPRVRGFTEDAAPNFTFETASSFYSGSKALAEEVMRNFPSAYVWRLRIPFAAADSPRNYLSKLQRYAKVYANWNSLSHLGEFVSACLAIAEARLPGGPYNVVNPGYVSTREVVELIRAQLRPEWQPEFWRDDAEFYAIDRARRSNCLLATPKLDAAGIRLRPVAEALEETLRHWIPQGGETATVG